MFKNKFKLKLLEHIENLKNVISEMDRVKQDIAAGNLSAQITFGDYTSPLLTYDTKGTENDWLQAKYSAQQFFKTIPGILVEGIVTHKRRIKILQDMIENRFISDEEHALLLQVEALKKDNYIINYKPCQSRYIIS